MSLSTLFLNLANKAMSGGINVPEWLDNVSRDLELYKKVGALTGKTVNAGGMYVYTGTHYYTKEQKQDFLKCLDKMDSLCRKHDVFFDAAGFNEPKPGCLTIEFCFTSRHDGGPKPEVKGRSPIYIQQRKANSWKTIDI